MVDKKDLIAFFEEFASSVNFSDYAPENVIDVIDINKRDDEDEECST